MLQKINSKPKMPGIFSNLNKKESPSFASLILDKGYEKW